MVTAYQRFKIIAKGRVQNVGYRYFALQAATKRQLVGFVKNEPNGTVLVEAEGPAVAIEQLIEDLEKGPDLARVNSLTVEKINSQGDEKMFKIKP